MTGLEIGCIIIVFVLLAVITAAAQFGWLPSGTPKTVLVSIAGIGIVVALRVANIPPWWFAGEKAGFGMAASLIIWGLVNGMGAGDERAFGMPLLLGMGIPLLLLNIAAFFNLHA